MSTKYIIFYCRLCNKPYELPEQYTDFFHKKENKKKQMCFECIVQKNKNPTNIVRLKLNN